MQYYTCNQNTAWETGVLCANYVNYLSLLRELSDSAHGGDFHLSTLIKQTIGLAHLDSYITYNYTNIYKYVDIFTVYFVHSFI